MQGNRQTLTYLKSLFASRGIAPNRRYGQNFLIDLNLHELILKAAEVNARDVILEVGAGTGALTELLAQHASAVVSVEIDPRLTELAAQSVSGLPNVRVLNCDALARKSAMAPEVLDQIRAGLAIAEDREFKLVANLPYNVATPIISNLLLHPELSPSLIAVTIQRELAERIVASPGSSLYSSLSVMVQALANPEIVRMLSPKVFWPRPKVHSAIIKIVPDPAKRLVIDDLAWFHHVVRRIFLLRRKHLRRVIYSLWRTTWPDKSTVDQLLDRLDLPGEVRAEMLNVSEFLDLSKALRVELKRLGAQDQCYFEEANDDHHDDSGFYSDEGSDGGDGGGEG